jgi:hypothetical protein
MIDQVITCEAIMPTALSKRMFPHHLARDGDPSLRPDRSLGRLVLFHLLRGLPEEQIGSDGGADVAQNDQRERKTELDVRHEGRFEDRQPGLFDDQSRQQVQKGDRGQNLQISGVDAVGRENLQRQRDQRCGEDQNDEGDRRHQTDRLGHGADIGADVDRVGDQDDRDGQIDDDGAVFVLDDGRQALAGHRADARASFLQGDQKRQGEQGRP